MANVNQCTFIGRLTRDPELKYLANQTAVVNSGFATNNKWRGANGEEREDVMFLDFQIFGKAAEAINQYSRKGDQLFLQGRLKLDQWEDRQGGGKRSKHVLIVEKFQFLGSAGGGNGGGNARPQREEQGASDRQDQDEFQDEDIPF